MTTGVRCTPNKDSPGQHCSGPACLMVSCRRVFYAFDYEMSINGGGDAGRCTKTYKAVQRQRSNTGRCCGST